MPESPKILCVVGARPNLMKMAPILRAFRSAAHPANTPLVHTGQHYDRALNQRFFEDLNLPWPDVNLEVGSGSHAVQTAQVMLRFEPVLEAEKPAAILVVGDVNSTLACALVAVKLGIPIIHVEAGLRSFDRSMPEEINRILTDQISDMLFITEEDASVNLKKEGIAESRIHFVGNVMIDSLQCSMARAIPAAQTLRALGMPEPDAPFALLTLHRPSNVDDPDTLRRLCATIAEVGEQIPVVFPLHPRTRSKMQEAGLIGPEINPRLLFAEPLGYLEMLGMMRDARFVMTDSGGVQEETTALGVPCLTLRENTERPITVSAGTNTLVGTASSAILGAVSEILSYGGKRGRVPALWDGHAAERIAEITLASLA